MPRHSDTHPAAMSNATEQRECVPMDVMCGFVWCIGWVLDARGRVWLRHMGVGKLSSL